MYRMFCLVLSAVLTLSCSMHRQSGEYETVIDPRVELLSIVQMLGGYGDAYGFITNVDMDYKREAQERFDGFKDHPAVTEFMKMTAGGFAADSPLGAMLYLSAPPELEQEQPFNDYLIKKGGGAERLEAFVALLRDFAQKSDFMTFYNEHRSFYDKVIASVISGQDGKKMVTQLERYFGYGQRSYTTVLIPLYLGGFSHWKKHEDGTFDLYNFCGSRGMYKGRTVFGRPGDMLETARHEFGHAFVNPLTTRHLERVNGSAGYYRGWIADMMKKQHYNDWESCVNEHIIRAVQLRLTLARKEQVTAEEDLKRYYRQGFVAIDLLYKALARYEEQRRKYPTFREFYPELLDIFNGIADGSVEIENPVYY